MLFSAPTQQWKIVKNNYGSGKFHYIEEFIPCDSQVIRSYTANEQSTEQAIRIAIQSNGFELAFRLLECYYEKANLTPPSEFSLLLAEKNNLIAQVNKDEIRRKEFNTEKLELFKKLLAFLDTDASNLNN